MLIVLSLALISINSIAAAADNQTVNITNTSEQNITNITNSSNTITVQNSTKITNNSNVTNSSNTTTVQKSTGAAGGSSYSKMKAVWLKAEDVNTLNVKTLQNLGITDVFVKTNLISSPTYQSVLTAVLQKLNGTNIRVHAWITCFIDANGNWVNPANETQRAFLVSSITDIVKNYDIAGINLDYVRYPGTAYKYTNATGTITSFVQLVYNTVKSINSSLAVSADLMPEESVNAYYYGQNYTQLAQYLDFLIPMIYKGNYGYDSSTGTNSNGKSGADWITSIVTYIVSQANGTPVIAGLQTYRSDDNVTVIPASELQNDINAAMNNGSSGYALFRYGLINSAFGVDSTPPYIKSVDPASNSVNVPINKTIKITFTESIKAGTGAISVKNLATGTYIPITTSISGNTLTITLNSNLAKGTQYSVIMNTGCLTDLAGNPLPGCSTKFTTASTTSFTLTQIGTAAANVKSYVETNNKLPNYVTIGSSQVTMPQFLQLLVTGLLQINSGTSTSMTLTSVNAPTNSSGSYMYVNIYKTDYLSIAQAIKSYINSNGMAPNYAYSSQGNIQYESLVYIYSKILNYYKTNGALPNYVLVDSSVTNTTIPSSLQQYLQTTTNCQVTNSQIQALAKSLTSGKSSAYDKAVAIFNWVRDNIGYSFYYNTKYGAAGTLNAKTGNCVDTAHLLIALERAAGIPARYEHVYAKFSSGSWYGHVIAQVYVNGKWYNADATSYSNTFGVINSWNTATATYYGTYATLPF